MRRTHVRVRGARALRRRARGVHPHRVDRPHLVALGDARCTSASPATLLARAEQVDGADRPRPRARRRRCPAHMRDAGPGLRGRRVSDRRPRAGGRRRRRGGRRHPARRRSPRCTRRVARPLERHRVRRGGPDGGRPAGRQRARRAPAPAVAVPIVYRGDTVAALWLGSAAATAAVVAELERAAALLAPVLPRRLGHGRRGVGARSRRPVSGKRR